MNNNNNNNTVYENRNSKVFITTCHTNPNIQKLWKKCITIAQYIEDHQNLKKNRWYRFLVVLPNTIVQSFDCLMCALKHFMYADVLALLHDIYNEIKRDQSYWYSISIYYFIFIFYFSLSNFMFFWHIISFLCYFS